MIKGKYSRSSNFMILWALPVNTLAEKNALGCGINKVSEILGKKYSYHFFFFIWAFQSTGIQDFLQPDILAQR